VGDEIEDLKEAKRTLIDDFERGYLERLLKWTGSNVSGAAALAGIGRHTSRELMRRHGFRGDD
jgi:DNA-binding protein Fis